MHIYAGTRQVSSLATNPMRPRWSLAFKIHVPSGHVRCQCLGGALNNDPLRSQCLVVSSPTTANQMWLKENMRLFCPEAAASYGSHHTMSLLLKLN